MNRHVLALVVALLLVTSGCLGGVQAPGQADRRSDTVQAITDANHTDIDELFGEHYHTLENTSSFTAVVNHYDNSSLTVVETVTADSESRRVLTIRDAVDRDVTVNQFTNATGRYYYQSGNASSASMYSTSPSPPNVSFQRIAVGEHPYLPPNLVLARFDFEFVGQRDGAYVFEADSLKPREEMTLPDWYWNVNDATNASATLVVEESGLIRHISTSVTLDNRDVVTTTGYEIHVSRLDQTSVSKPSWVEEAVAADGRVGNQSA